MAISNKGLFAASYSWSIMVASADKNRLALPIAPHPTFEQQLTKVQKGPKKVQSFGQCIRPKEIDRLNPIFWIVIRCGTVHFGRRALEVHKPPKLEEKKNGLKLMRLGPPMNPF